MAGILLLAVGLSGADYNRYGTILQSKCRLAKNSKVTSEPNLADEPEIDDRRIGVFGETEVKQYRQSQKRLSAAEKEIVVQEYKSGKTTYELAQQFGCHRRTIAATLEKHGVKPDKRKAQKKLDPAKIIALYEKRYTLKEVAKCFNVNSRVISQCLRDNGVKIRSRWDY